MEYLIGAAAVIIGLPMLFAAGTRKPDQSFSDRMGEVGDAIGRGGDAMQKVGCGLTLTITLPLLGFALFGPVGAVVGLLIGLAFVGSAFSGKES